MGAIYPFPRRERESALSALPSIDGVPPPHDFDAESAVLGAILIKGVDSLNDISGLFEPEDLYSGFHQRVFAAIKAVNEKSLPIDVATVAIELNAGGGGSGQERHDLVMLTDAAPAVTRRAVVAYARGIREAAAARGLAWAMERFRLEIYHRTRPALEVAQDARQAATMAIDRLSHSGGTVTAKDALVSLAQTMTKPVVGVTTGFNSLNEWTNGFKSGELIVVGGRPGMGKTSLALWMAMQAAAAGVRALFISMEMDNGSLLKRAVCAMSRVPFWRLQRADLTPEGWGRVTQAAVDIQNHPLTLSDKSAQGVDEIRQKARDCEWGAKKERGPAQIVFVDHIGIMAGSRKSEKRSREQEVSEISRGLKSMAMDMGIPVVVLCQLQRDVAKGPNKRPQLHNLRESGAIEQDADVVIFAHREQYYEATADDGAELIVAKQRNGRTGTLPMRFERECMRFEEVRD